VSKRFGGVLAVEDVSFKVAAGEAIAVIGPNGAGKSTLLKAIAGGHRPTSGAVYLDRLRLDRLAGHDVPRHGVVLAHQIPRPFGALTVRENVLVAAQARTGRRAGRDLSERVDDVLQRCGLADKRSRPAQTLALLDLKRLELARSLATRPSVLLLDEVAAGLVGRELATTIDLVAGIHATGVTMIVVEHVEQVVRSLVTRVIVLDWGRQIAEGAPEEIQSNPQVRSVYLGSGGEEPRVGASRSGARGGDPKPTLELREVSAGYGQLTAIREVDLSIGSSGAVAILGANGAGKSTLCSVVSGLVPARTGTILLDGIDVTRQPAHVRARRGIVHCPEGRRVFSDLTVVENLKLGALLSVREPELRRRLDRVRAIFPSLADRLGQRAGSLSGGQQQMLAIGRALVSQPRLLICDEISLGLSPAAVDALYEALERIIAEGVAVALVEQNVNRALQVADRAYVLRRGLVSYSGDARPLLDPRVLDDAYFGEAEARRLSGAAEGGGAD
jgi:ABC-type branched-subunit amino acid transport system ATPase component